MTNRAGRKNEKPHMTNYETGRQHEKSRMTIWEPVHNTGHVKSICAMPGDVESLEFPPPRRNQTEDNIITNKPTLVLPAFAHNNYY